MQTEEKIFFTPGMVVQLKQDIPNKPLMVVVRKETSMFKHSLENKDNSLKGIRCMWFTENGDIREYTFNTKDLKLIK